mmetsp:Transcript_26277/g.59258  ORF Transcript_26277/g.59258 Transcript_26277/m.59258 type:complete len:213 (+) Transcript_26277:3757-4395(+)
MALSLSPSCIAALAPSVAAIMRGEPSSHGSWSAAPAISFPAADRADLCDPASSWHRASTSQASAVLSAGGTRRRAPRAASQSGASPPAKDRKTPSRIGLRPAAVAVPSAPTEAAPPPPDDESSPPANFAKCASYSALRASASSTAALSSSLRFSSLASSSLSLASLSRCLLTDWKAHWSRFSHFSLKSASTPLFMSARIRSAPASSYSSSFL